MPTRSAIIATETFGYPSSRKSSRAWTRICCLRSFGRRRTAAASAGICFFSPYRGSRSILSQTSHSQEGGAMTGNRAVAYIEPGKVEVQDIPYPKLELQDGPGVTPANVGRKCEHGVILKVVSTNICGSDQHMVRGRTTAPAGLVLGHEILGEVIEKGKDVLFLNVGDLVSVPFNVACGRCRACRERNTGVCLNVNKQQPGGAYGYVDMGGWIGGQADYVLVPFADFNLLKFPDKDQAMEKIRDLTMLSDILPTGFHGAKSAGV